MSAKLPAHGTQVLTALRNRVGTFAWRPRLGIEQLAALVSLFFCLFANDAFWRAVVATDALNVSNGWMIAVSLFVATAALNMLMLCVLLNRWTAKPLLTALLLVTAAASYYMNEYTVYLDTDMIRNVLHTDSRESAELITTGFVAHVVGYGLLPALLIWWVKLQVGPLGRALLIRGACIVGATLVAALAILLSFQDLAALMRNNRELRHLITPGNFIVSLARVALDDRGDTAQPRIPVGADAKVSGRERFAKPRVLVIVVGETVRAQNWGLNGYMRETTPELRRIAPINFVDVTACGSSTEVSVPCMFSAQGRRNYDERQIARSESLLHVLEHAGIPTSWRDNQSGCKGVCEGLTFKSFKDELDVRHCTSAGCLDDILLEGLTDEIDRAAGDLVVVLHQLGNHGPSYFERYPARLRRFTPTCDTSEIGQCSQQAIVNTYDNATLYTDQFLAKTIHLLAAQPERDTAMIYVSDHGESLGERGLYLHGMPQAIVPDQQIKVPMVMWISPGLASTQAIDLKCMRSISSAPASHDNLFHSVLGLMQVETSDYDPRMDLFRSCSAR